MVIGNLRSLFEIHGRIILPGVNHFRVLDVFLNVLAHHHRHFQCNVFLFGIGAQGTRVLATVPCIDYNFCNRRILLACRTKGSKDE